MAKKGFQRNGKYRAEEEFSSSFENHWAAENTVPAERVNVCLMGLTFSTKNMGVSALAAGTVKCAALGFPGARLSILDYGRKPEIFDVSINGNVIRVPLVNLRFSKKFFLKNNLALLLALALIAKLIPFPKSRKRLLRKNSYWSQITEFDVFAAISGGDSFSDIYGIGRFLYVALPQVLVLLMGKPLVLLPQTLGPFKGSLTRRLATWIIRHSVVTYSRDWEGVKEWRQRIRNGEIRSHGEARKEIPHHTSESLGRGRIRFSYDVGFAVEPVRPQHKNLGALQENPKGSRALVGLNISGLLYSGGYTGKNMFRLNADYRDLLGQVIDFFARKERAIILLVPHVFGSEEHFESDQVACRKIMNQVEKSYQGKIFMAQGAYDQSEIKYIIGMCDFFIGSRMHACIAALSQCIPTVGIAYSRKFRGVMESIGVGEIVADPRKMNATEVLQVVETVWKNRGTIREHLEREIPKVKEKALALFGEIAEITGFGKRLK